jgi:hypothetical protein
VTIDDVRQEALRVLREDYARASQAIIELEVFTHSPSKKAVHQLRDFLDHLHYIFATEDVSLANSHLEEAKTHLRRCVLEPIEYLAEKQFVEVDECCQQWILSVPFKENPARQSDFLKRMREAKQWIAKGRMRKTDLGAYDDFHRAFEITTDLLNEVHPYQWRAKAIWWTVQLLAAGVAVGGAIIAGVLFLLHSSSN